MGTRIKFKLDKRQNARGQDVVLLTIEDTHQDAVLFSRELTPDEANQLANTAVDSSSE